MKPVQPIVIIAFLMALTACKHVHQPAAHVVVNDTAISKNTAIKPALIDINNPVSIDSSKNLMFRLSFPSNDDDGSFLIKKNIPSASYWNIVFYNPNTHVYHLLDKRKMLITDSRSKYDTPGVSVYGKWILYNIIVNDFDRNGKLDNADPAYLFITDTAGNNFRQVSPDGLDITNWQLAGNNQLLMVGRNDTNNDGVFDQKDNRTTYIYDFTSGKPAAPVFSTGFKNDVDNLFTQQWGKNGKN